MESSEDKFGQSSKDSLSNNNEWRPPISHGSSQSDFNKFDFSVKEENDNEESPNGFDWATQGVGNAEGEELAMDLSNELINTENSSLFDRSYRIVGKSINARKRMSCKPTTMQVSSTGEWISQIERTQQQEHDKLDLPNKFLHNKTQTSPTMSQHGNKSTSFRQGSIATMNSPSSKDQGIVQVVAMAQIDGFDSLYSEGEGFYNSDKLIGKEVPSIKWRICSSNNKQCITEVPQIRPPLVRNRFKKRQKKMGIGHRHSYREH